MGHTVREKANIVGTYRRTSIILMETLASWVPTTPELEAKALFGRHLWDFAQHADDMGQRTSELRASRHYNREPQADFRAVLSEIAATASTAQRLSVMYDAAIPHVEERYADYMAQTDHLLDEPTVRILERARTDLARMRQQRDELLQDRPRHRVHLVHHGPLVSMSEDAAIFSGG